MWDDAKRTVWSTEKGRVCPTCGWPAGECRCSTSFDETVPDRPTAVLRLEKKGRRGKAVTVIAGLPRNAAFLKELCSELKRGCGSGGTVSDGAIEIQGDQRERLRVLLLARRFVVKG